MTTDGAPKPVRTDHAAALMTRRLRIERRLRRHRDRFWRAAVLGVALCLLADTMSPDPYAANVLPRVGPGWFCGMSGWCAYAGDADARVSLGWVWELRFAVGAVNVPHIEMVWLDLRSLRWLTLPLAAAVLTRRWAALQAWTTLHARRTRPTAHCLGCGYDLAGLSQHARCPECGARRSDPPCDGDSR